MVVYEKRYDYDGSKKIAPRNAISIEYLIKSKSGSPKKRKLVIINKNLT